VPRRRADDSADRANADERLSPLLRGSTADIPGALALRLGAPNAAPHARQSG
jgi:hypothetical protein